MVSRKGIRASASNTAKKMKISQEEPGIVQFVPAVIDAPQPSDSFLEFVSIKEEPVDVSSPTSGQDRQSPVDSSPKPQPKKSGAGKVKRSYVCELCLRKCPATMVVKFSLRRGENISDGLQKIEHALGIQLEPRPFDVCRICWQLVVIVVTFKDGCLKARNWRMVEKEFYRDGDDEWFSGKTAKAMGHALQILQSNLDSFENRSEEVLDAEDDHDESSSIKDELNVKDDTYAPDEDKDLDETIASQDEIDEYNKVTEKLEIEIEEHPKEHAIKTDKAKIELPTDLTPLPVYECTKCGRRFDSKNGLGVHVRRTEDSPDDVCKNSVPLESPHCCTVCILYFKSKSLLKCHMDKHLGTKSLACRKGCGKMFYTGAMLRVHEHDCGTELGKRLCPHCGLNFVSTSHLIRHMTQVHGEANFPCKVCGKRFKTREAVGRHMTFSHSTENTLSCNLCNKMYKNPDSLRVHMRLHTNEMPYGCDICGKRFRYGQAVRPHKLREHGAGRAEAEEGDGGE